MDNQQPSTNRICKTCGVEKPLEQFPIYVAGRHRHSCKECRREYHDKWRAGEIEPRPIDPSSRQCRQCGAVKPIDEFATVYARNSRGQNYRRHTCADCERKRHADQMMRFRREHGDEYRAYRRAHRAKNVIKARTQRRESGRRLRDECFSAYGGYRCTCCGEICPSMLTLDHINEDGAAHRNALNGGLGRKKSVDMYRKLKEAGYPGNIQVLCYNCNISKHRKGGVCEHAIK